MPGESVGVETIRLVTVLPERVVEALIGDFADGGHYAPKYLIRGRAVDVYRPDGTLLLALRPRRLRPSYCRFAWDALLRAAKPTNRRAVAAGGAEKLYSGTMGYHKGQPTRWTWEDMDGWRSIGPLLRDMARVFRAACPERYAVLAKQADRTPRGHLIPGTPFTTAAANRWSHDRNARMAVHRDDGNLPGAFGAMTVLREGEYRGGLLVFPKYRVAVDLRSRDVLIADNREAHGNTDIVGVDSEFNRISVVCYYHASNAPPPG